MGHEITDERRTQFGDAPAPFGTDAQNLWLRNLLPVARLAEQAGRREEAMAAHGTLQFHWSDGDKDSPLVLAARKGIARVSGRTVPRTLNVRPVRF